jgi:glutamine amidotransferase
MIALIDYGAGNTASVANSLKSIDVDYKITDREKDICEAQKVIFPGVGEASFTIKKLHLLNLFNLLRILKKPLLGICVGMQVMSEKMKEGNAAGLGIIPVNTEIFDSSQVKVPHMGWNRVKIVKNNVLFDGIDDETYFYFANSFYVPYNEFTIASSSHGLDFSAAIQKENIYGVQFHPEKSGEAGMKLLKNFAELA